MQSKHPQPLKKKKKLNKELDITKFNFRRDRVLVKAIRPESDELVDPKQYEDKPEFGEVIKLGEEVKDLKVGQIIRFGKYSTELIRTQGEDYFIVHEEDISADLPWNH